MTWMDSYAKIHALTLSWVSRDKDMIDWTDAAIDPLTSTPDMAAMLWIVSALWVITSRPAPSGVAPRIYRWARWAIATRIWRVIDDRMDKECP
jgi:hypothetical protein